MGHPVKIRRGNMQAIVFFALVSAVLFEAIGTGCGQNEGAPAKKLSQEDEAAKALSEIHCRSCHAYPSPYLLDRNSWNNVLFSMEVEMKKEGYQIKDEDWFSIQRYYLSQAPAALPVASASQKKLDKACAVFQKTDKLSNVEGAIPVSSLVKYDQASNTLYTGDLDRNLFIFKGSELSQKLQLGTVPIDILPNQKDGSLDVLCIGADLMPTQGRGGEIMHISKDGEQKRIVDFLDRPVQFLRQDFDGDGREEFLVSCFGSLVGPLNTGKLTLYTAENGVFKEHKIKEMPGAIKSVTGDFNQDGKPDIIALFAQGREFLSLFLNKGNLEFEEKQLLEFPPIHGSNDFELADVNGDSYPDLIVTNGDNGDNSPVFKPYHGVRIFINDGKFAFSEKFFFPINGASKVLARDFDGDQDLDMVVLAMYPNLAAYPQEALVYFENKGKLDFEASYLEKEASNRWVLLDAGDVDGDGDLDLVAGTNMMVMSILLPPDINSKWRQSKETYAVFENVFNQK
jgi:hypothetical protein